MYDIPAEQSGVINVVCVCVLPTEMAGVVCVVVCVRVCVIYLHNCLEWCVCACVSLCECLIYLQNCLEWCVCVFDIPAELSGVVCVCLCVSVCVYFIYLQNCLEWCVCVCVSVYATAVWMVDVCVCKLTKPRFSLAVRN